MLTPANVTAANFGELFSNPLDGQVYAQPLYLSQVAIAGKGTRNVVYVATCHDTIYAFDADAGGDPLWTVSFIAPEKGITPVPQPDVISGDVVPEIGIIGTPVIDPASGTLYLVAKTKETGRGDNHVHYVQKLHALDVGSGAEKPNSPCVIGDLTCDNASSADIRTFDYNLALAPDTPRVKGSSHEAVEGIVYLNALRANQRASLSLYNGVVYVLWASHGDMQPYHGWVVGFDARTLRPLPDRIFCVTPDGDEGGIWQGGCGASFDDAGNIYFSTANGWFNGNNGGRNWAQSFLRFSTSAGFPQEKFDAGPGRAFDYFSTFDEEKLSNADVDMGTDGMLVFDVRGAPVPHLVLGGSKVGYYYLLNRDDLGQHGAGTDRVVQKVEKPDGHENMATPVFFNQTLYYNRNGEDLRARVFVHGQFAENYSHTAETFAGRGGGPIISAHDTKDAIVWMLNKGWPAALHAYDADALASTPADHPVPALFVGRLQDGGVKFTHPLVINGKVYVVGASRRGNHGARGHLYAFGLFPPGLSTAPPQTPDHLEGTSTAPGSVALRWVSHDSTVTAFRVERSPLDLGQFELVGTTGRETVFVDNGVSGATAYQYRVSAVNPNGTSAPSPALGVKSHDYLSEVGLVACWSLDESNGKVAHDVTGHAHEGQLVGEVSWSQGVAGTSGLEFHGTGQAQSRVEVRDSPDLKFDAHSNFTISIWARPTSLPGRWAAATAKARASATGGYGIFIAPDNTWSFRGPDATKNLNGGSVLNNSWQHLVAVQNGAAGTRTLYVNGVNVASGPVAQAADGAGALWIGQANADNEAFPGNLDEARIYARALNADEIKTLLGTFLPVVAIREPADRETLASGQDILFKAEASTSAPDAAVTEVRFYEGKKRLGDGHGVPYTWTWSHPPPGDHLIVARASDSNGNTVESLPVRLKGAP